MDRLYVFFGGFCSLIHNYDNFFIFTKIWVVVMRQALFFLRHYNDVDHIVPVIHKWSYSGYRCTVVLIGFAEISKDYRIQHISTLAHVDVLDIRELLIYSDQLRFRFVSMILYGNSCQYFSSKYFKCFEIFWSVKKRNIFWDKVAGLLLSTAFAEKTEGVVVFDWISNKSTLPIEFVQRLLLQCKLNNYTSISLPHGDRPHINTL